MTSKRLGEMFKGDSADMCAGNFSLVSMGERANGQAGADGERGPPSARLVIFLFQEIHPNGYIFVETSFIRLHGDYLI